MPAASSVGDEPLPASTIPPTRWDLACIQWRCARSRRAASVEAGGGAPVAIASERRERARQFRLSFCSAPALAVRPTATVRLRARREVVEFTRRVNGGRAWRKRREPSVRCSEARLLAHVIRRSQRLTSNDGLVKAPSRTWSAWCPNAKVGTTIAVRDPLATRAAREDDAALLPAGVPRRRALPRRYPGDAGDGRARRLATAALRLVHLRVRGAGWRRPSRSRGRAARRSGTRPRSRTGAHPRLFGPAADARISFGQLQRWVVQQNGPMNQHWRPPPTAATRCTRRTSSSA